MTLSQFFRHVYCRRRFLSSESIPTYKSAVTKFQNWHGKPVLLSRLTGDLLRSFLAEYRLTRSNESVNNKRSKILILWRFAHRWGFVKAAAPESWEIPTLPTPRRIPKAWTVEQFGRILEACCDAPTINRNGMTWMPSHWKALFLVIYDTGERLNPLLKTLRCELSATGHLTIRGELRKGKKRDIVRKLHAQTIAAIKAMPLHYQLFPWPLCQRAIFHKVNPILIAAGLPADRRSKFHCVRRTSATQVAVSLGLAAAQQHMDHSSIQLTADRYVDPTFLPEHDVADLIQRPAIFPDTPAE